MPRRAKDSVVIKFMVYLFSYILLLGTKGDDGGADICGSREEKDTLMARVYF
jgi:hypothetical protein